jgi:hypothetical protein
MTPELIGQRAGPLIAYIRKTHPAVPLVLAEDTDAGSSWIDSASAALQDAKRAELHKAFAAAVAAGDRNLHYVNASVFYRFASAVATDPRHVISPTVGGCHPSDLGQQAMADFYAGYLPALLLHEQPGTPVGWTPTMLSRPTAPTTTAETAVDREVHAAVLEATMGPHVRTATPAETDYVWTDVETSDLVVMGRAFNQTADGPGGYFNRLPAAANGVVRDAVWKLSQMSTGMFVPFVTTSTEISWNFSLVGPPDPMWHMPASGMHGADLFCFDGSQYRYIGAAMAYPTPGSSESVVLGSDFVPAGTERRCVIYLPLRNTIVAASIGALDAAVKPDPEFSADGVTWSGKKPIVWYGTSIEQGGVASRPGSTYTNILSRALNRTVLNFGFAGNGVCFM